jgi:hypothetical protein
MKNILLFRPVLSITFLFCLLACSKTETPTPVVITPSNTIKKGAYLGISTPMNTGTAQTFVNFLADDVPSSLGVTLSKGAWESIISGTFLTVPIPAEAKSSTSFVYLSIYKAKTNILFQYNQEDIFYFHFWLQDKTIQDVILTDLQAKNDVKLLAEPPSGVIPVEFNNKNGLYSNFGRPYYNTLSDEWNNKIFTHNMCLSSYDSKLINYCPMIAQSAIMNKPNYTVNVPLTTQKGYFPSKFSIKQDGDNIVITLDELKLIK